MEAYHEDKFADSADRLLKLRRNPNKMDVLRRFQGHYVNWKISYLLEPPSLSFRVSSEETEESILSICAPSLETLLPNCCKSTTHCYSTEEA